MSYLCSFHAAAVAQCYCQLTAAATTTRTETRRLEGYCQRTPVLWHLEWGRAALESDHTLAEVLVKAGAPLSVLGGNVKL